MRRSRLSGRSLGSPYVMLFERPSIRFVSGRTPAAAPMKEMNHSALARRRSGASRQPVTSTAKAEGDGGEGRSLLRDTIGGTLT